MIKQAAGGLLQMEVCCFPRSPVHGGAGGIFGGGSWAFIRAADINDGHACIKRFSRDLSVAVWPKLGFHLCSSPPAPLLSGVTWGLPGSMARPMGGTLSSSGRHPCWAYCLSPLMYPFLGSWALWTMWIRDLFGVAASEHITVTPFPTLPSALILCHGALCATVMALWP